MTAPKCPCPSFELHGESTADSPVAVCTCRHTADEHDEHGECQGRLPVGVVTRHGKEVIDLREWWLRHGDLETAFRELRDQGMTYEEIAEACNVPSVSIVYTVLDREELAQEHRASEVIDRVRNLPAPADVPAHDAYQYVAADDAYFSVGYDRATGGVLVWRVGGAQPPEIAALYTALATPDVPVTVRDALVSWKQAKTIMDALTRDASALRAEGIMLITIGVAHEGVPEGRRPGRVEIGVSNLTPAIAEKLLQRYADPTIGRDKVVVVEKEQYANRQPPIPDMAEAVTNLKADTIIRDMAAELLSEYRSGQSPAIPGWDGRQAGLLLNEYHRRGGQVEAGIGGPTLAIRELAAEWGTELPPDSDSVDTLAERYIAERDLSGEKLTEADMQAERDRAERDWPDLLAARYIAERSAERDLRGEKLTEADMQAARDRAERDFEALKAERDRARRAKQTGAFEGTKPGQSDKPTK
jgi:hypothetical protein